MKIVIAGASGFVGQGFLHRESTRPESDREYIGISREAKKSEPNLEWRAADLLDLAQTRKAIAGADTAMYLVHAMLPKAKLSQGTFQDFDLFQADNFARACKAEGIEHIVYLAGLIPEGVPEAKLSEHLRSRLEVERALGSQGARVTVLRAGLIVGPSGSSTEILFRLVKRLPLMVLPAWTRNRVEIVDLDDVIEALRAVVRRRELQGKVWDLGCGEAVPYENLIRLTAKLLHKKPGFVHVPVFTPRISKYWVRLVTGAPPQLVYPLIDSLSHSMVPRLDHRLFSAIQHVPRTLEESLRLSLESPQSKPHAYKSSGARIRYVHSIQRLPLQAKSLFLQESGDIGGFYFQWLPSLFRGLLRVDEVLDSTNVLNVYEIHVLGLKTPLLRLQRLTPTTYQVVGGMLATDGDLKGLLEFRVLPAFSCLLCSLQSYVPRLPWLLYRFTQAMLHIWVVRRLGKALASPDDYLVDSQGKPEQFAK